jgi:hypothetical protein
MASTQHHQFVFNDVPPSIASKLYAWKLEHGGLYLAPIKPKALDAAGRLVTDLSAPWLVVILREATVREFLAYADLATHDPHLAASGLIQHLFVYSFDATSGDFVNVLNMAGAVDCLFGLYTEVSGFFRGNPGIAVKRIRETYGAKYHKLILQKLVTNVGFKIDDLLDKTDSELEELAFIYLTQGRQQRQRGVKTGIPALDRQLDKQALVDASAEQSMEALKSKMAADRATGVTEKLDVDKENAELQWHFGEAVLKGRVPHNVKGMKRSTMPVPDFSGKTKR